MITKERLEELIEQGATIFSTHADYKEIKLNNDFKVEEVWCLGDCLVSKSLVFSLFGISLIFLFETKEDAEEYAEFGNIARMERLELPSWEDVKDTGYDEIFFVKDNRFDSGVVQYYFLVAEQTNQIQIMFREIEHIMTIDAYDVIFSKPLTRENYDEARRLCVKLFKGEEV